MNNLISGGMIKPTQIEHIELYRNPAAEGADRDPFSDILSGGEKKVEKYIKDKVITILMSENIKIHENDKKLFDMLQAELILKTGEKITQQELFSQLIEFVRSRKESFFGRLSKLPLSEREKKKIRSIPIDMGVETSEEEIDMVVYGARR